MFPAREGDFPQAAVMIPAGSFPSGPAEPSKDSQGFIYGVLEGFGFLADE
jgi:hypothetical protein